MSKVSVSTNRRKFLQSSALLAASLVPATATAREYQVAEVRPFQLDEATITDLQKGLDKGQFSSVALVRKYLARAGEVDSAGPRVNSIIETNPEALAIARQMDRERRAGKIRGPLHGIPILIKDNIATHDRMMTTAGSMALHGSIAPKDSFVAQQLRRAGAIILGKTNLSEWANFRSNRSSSGWSGRGGQTRNPYVLTRNPSGSSSGSGAAVSANLCAAAVGTETDGSIVSPSSACGIVGIKPTVGLIPRTGIIPISHTQDTAGPMARTVRDAAILLAALAGADASDPRSLQNRGEVPNDYTRFLDRAGLKGARIGVLRQLFSTNKQIIKVMEDAVGVLKQEGALVVDPADWAEKLGTNGGEFQVLLYEFKAGLNEYLARLGPGAPVRTLEEVIKYNDSHPSEELPFFGQETLIDAQKKGDLGSTEYLDALKKCREYTAKGIDLVMKKHSLDALISPTFGPAHATDLVYGDRGVPGSSTPAAVAGYPSVTLPAGFAGPLPIGISFCSHAWQEPTLLKLAYAFEQATKVRRAPRFLSDLV